MNYDVICLGKTKSLDSLKFIVSIAVFPLSGFLFERVILLAFDDNDISDNTTYMGQNIKLSIFRTWSVLVYLTELQLGDTAR